MTLTEGNITNRECSPSKGILTPNCRKNPCGPTEQGPVNQALQLPSYREGEFSFFGRDKVSQANLAMPLVSPEPRAIVKPTRAFERTVSVLHKAKGFILRPWG